MVGSVHYDRRFHPHMVMRSSMVVYPYIFIHQALMKNSLQLHDLIQSIIELFVFSHLAESQEDARHE